MNTDMSDHIEAYMNVVKARASLYLAELSLSEIQDATPLGSEGVRLVEMACRAMNELEIEWKHSVSEAPAKGDYTVAAKLTTAMRKLVKSFWLLNSVSTSTEQ